MTFVSNLDFYSVRVIKNAICKVKAAIMEHVLSRREKRKDFLRS